MAEMTPEALKAVAKKHGGYANPTLNDQLFLHCQGFAAIQNLEPYTEVRVLWLEQNALEKIEGLTNNEKLVTLFLQNNFLRSIGGLESLSNLRIINLSHNYLACIKNIAAFCPLLESLQISHNQIESLEDCRELQELKYLSSVDLSYNKLQRPEGATDSYLYEFFGKMPSIAVLYLQGQPLCMGVKNYRKNMVWHIQTLTYLDERPIFADERRTVNAWGGGNLEAENAERETIRKEKHDHLTGCVKTLSDMADKMKDVRAARTVEWEAIKEAERKLKLEHKAARRTIENDEEDSRVIVTCDESSEWVDLVEQLGKELLAAEAEDEVRQAANAEQNALEAVAKQEIAREEATLKALVEAADTAASTEKSQKRDEVAFWVKQMELTEDEIVTQMEDEMTEMLKFMRPSGGYKDIGSMVAAAKKPAESTDESSQPVRAAATKAKHSDPTSDTPVHLLADETKPVPRKALFSKERVWAQYDAWESLQMGNRRPKKTVF
eukprot:GILI01013112.1.p1 GENE.GILI01013112.1~~GILI01013112.1.p1  ORF type:complete len:517 (-),score=140.12 GILI01013112.1:199-1680(-)